MLVFAYGAFAYLGFLGVFGAAVAFLANVGPVRGVDGGAPGDVATSVAIDVALVALFGVSHSVMARGWFKRRLGRLVPQAAERSTYVLVTNVTLGLLFWQWRPLTGAVWSVESAAARAALWGASGVGILLTVYATALTNHFDLFGMRQVWLHARGQPYTPVPFKERSLYRYVRHPMMLGMLLWFWATPAMSAGHLLFAAAMTGYVLVGVRLEERDLGRNLGEAYLAYRARVGRFVPRV